METTLERKRRLARERQRRHRAKMTPEQKAAKRAADACYRSWKLSCETVEQAKARRTNSRMRQAIRFAMESVKEVEKKKDQRRKQVGHIARESRGDECEEREEALMLKRAVNCIARETYVKAERRRVDLWRRQVNERDLKKFWHKPAEREVDRVELRHYKHLIHPKMVYKNKALVGFETEPSSLGYPEQTEVTPTVKQSPNRSPYGVSSIQPESLSYPTPAKLQKKNEQQFLEEIRQASFSQSGLIGEPAVEFPQHFSSHVAEPAASLATPVLVAPPKPVEKPRIIEKRIIVVADHQRCVMSNLASLWKSGKLCDAGIGNGSSTVMVHKVVLSAMCPKLISVFSKDMISHKFLQVNFPSQVSTEALNAFAEYMYNGILDLDPDILQQLKIIAKKLDMKEFEQLCDSHLPNQHHQPVAAAATSSISFNNLPLIQTSVPIIPSIPTSHQTLNISSSVGSGPSATDQMIDVKPQISKADLPQLQKDPAAVFGKESVLTSSAPNQSAIGQSIKPEPLGPDDHKYGHIESVSNHEALPQSSLSSSSIPTSSIAAPSTDLTISFLDVPDVKPIIKTSPSTDALPVSDTSLVPSSQSANVKETNWQPSFTVSAAGPSLTNETPYPIAMFVAKRDNLPLMTQENNKQSCVTENRQTVRDRRRARAAEYMRRYRAIQNEEIASGIRQKNANVNIQVVRDRKRARAEYMRRYRANQNEDKASERRLKNAATVRRARSQETLEEAAKRRQQSRDRYRNRINAASGDELKDIRSQMSSQALSRRQFETNDGRRRRLEQARIRSQMRRAHETVDETNKRLTDLRLRAQRRRQEESKEERNRRLDNLRNRARLRRENQKEQKDSS